MEVVGRGVGMVGRGGDVDRVDWLVSFSNSFSSRSGLLFDWLCSDMGTIDSWWVWVEGEGGGGVRARADTGMGVNLLLLL